MEKINYRLELEKTLNEITASGARPTLLLHCCCAPCSSYVLEYLSEYFDITCYFYNPNISPEAEYIKRRDELIGLVEKMHLTDKVTVYAESYDPEPFKKLAYGKERSEEGGERCFECYKLRLSHAAEYAASNSFDYFTTTLTISPYKNASKLNEIGGALAREYGISYLFSDFKKRNGYRRSCELSKQYDLYRQNYCGCIYSKLASEEKHAHSTSSEISANDTNRS